MRQLDMVMKNGQIYWVVREKIRAAMRCNGESMF
jgi:hypothetical protein